LEERGFAEPLAAVLGEETYVHARFARPGATIEAAWVGLEQTLAIRSSPLRRAEREETVRALVRDPSDGNKARYEELTTQGQSEVEFEDAVAGSAWERAAQPAGDRRS
jgi:hypothetical protein